MLFGKCSSRVKNLLEVASAVNNDAQTLLHDVVGYGPLKLIRMFCRLVEWNTAFKKRGSEDIMSMTTALMQLLSSLAIVLFPDPGVLDIWMKRFCGVCCDDDIFLCLERCA